MCSLLSYRFYGTSEKQCNTAAEPLVLLTCWVYIPMLSDSFIRTEFKCYFHCDVETSLTLAYE